MPTKVSLIRVKASRKAVYITRCVCTSSTAGDSGEANENRCLLVCGGKKRGSSQVRPVAVGREDSVGSDAAGVNSTLGDLG